MQVYTQEDELIERWQWNDPALRNLSQVVLQLLKEQQGRVLDLGCGTGRLAADLARAGFSVDGVDTEERAIVIGRRIMQKHGLDVHLYVGHIFDSQLPVAAGGYDVLVCTEVLEHVDTWRELLDRGTQLLRPGGVIVVSVPRDPAQFSVLDEYAGHVRRFRDNELIKELQRCYSQLVIRRLGWPSMRSIVWMYSLVNAWRGGSHARNSQTLWHSPRFSQRVALAVFYLLLRFDNLFSRLPFGTTLVIRACKHDY